MSWYQYEEAREQRSDLLRKLERRKAAGERFEPLAVPQGAKLARTFWGKAWCDHLENHSDYEHRLPRGRTYLRQGNVYNLSIEPGVIRATVLGSRIYEVQISIRPLQRDSWEAFKEECSGEVASLLDLLAGKLGDGVLRAISAPDHGLFPERDEIRLSCTCPDWANMCKHVAAVLYGVGVRLDTAPELFFVLRSVDPSELLANAGAETLQEVSLTDTELAGEDLGALFGIDLGEPPARSK